MCCFLSAKKMSISWQMEKQKLGFGFCLNVLWQLVLWSVRFCQYKMFNISLFLTLQSYCMSFDPKAAAEALRWFCQGHTKRLFRFIQRPKYLFLLFLGSTIPSKEVLFTGWGYANRNVWLSVCVLVAWTCSPISAITTGNDQPFALKSQRSVFHYSHYLQRHEATYSSSFPTCSPCTHPPLLHTQRAVPQNVCYNAEQASISIENGRRWLPLGTNLNTTRSLSASHTRLRRLRGHV